MAMPVSICPLHFTKDVAHCLAPSALSHQAVLWPICEVLQIEGQVVLQTCQGPFSPSCAPVEALVVDSKFLANISICSIIISSMNLLRL